MNENIDLTKILKYCPKGTKLYSTIFGEVEFKKIDEESNYPIVCVAIAGNNCDVTADGRYYDVFGGECILFPSKEQRDWSKFTASWYKKDKFDPKTLKPFDRVLVSYGESNWKCKLFSHIDNNESTYKYDCCDALYAYCIPYNDDTKHLVGTAEEAPEYYRYWEE